MQVDHRFNSGRAKTNENFSHSQNRNVRLHCKFRIPTWLNCLRQMCWWKINLNRLGLYVLNAMLIGLPFNTAQNLAGKCIFSWKCSIETICQGVLWSYFYIHYSYLCMCMHIYVYTQRECMHIYDYKRHTNLNFFPPPYFE